MNILGWIGRRGPYTKLALAILVVVGGLAGYKVWTIKKAMAMNWGPPPESVTTTIVSEQQWTPQLDYVGSLAANQGATLSSEEPGTVAAIKFESGATVKTGDVLVQLDTAVEVAQLKSASAKLDLARVNLKRIEELRKADATSVQAWNSAVSDQRQAESEMERISAIIRRKTVTAPFDGRAGIRMVNIGQYVTPGTPIVPLYALNPIFANFSVPQQEVSKIRNGQMIEARVDAFENEKFSGAITAIDPQVDESSRTVRIQATIPNPSERLTPGMFTRVAVEIGAPQTVIAVPASSISYNPYGNAVFVVDQITPPEGGDSYLGVRQQFVELGRAKGDLITITKGLKVGDQVVTGATFKLRPNAKIVVNNSVAPGSDPNPKPEDS